MDAIQTSFSRVEWKYLLSREQAERLGALAAERLEPDRYHRYRVANVYYDTEDHFLIRNSLDKPYFKQKLRLRSYGVPGDRDPVFMELKKKLDGRVLKRRVTLPAEEAIRYLEGKPPAEKGQIHREIDAFLAEYRPGPRIYIGYEREAFREKPGEPELRLTFDREIRYRWNDLDLRLGDDGVPLLPEEAVLLELKSQYSFPLWLVRFLEQEGIRRISFSKYGAAFRRDVLGESLSFTEDREISRPQTAAANE